MNIYFTTFFEQYEALRLVADSVFARVKNEHADRVTCKIECADCCHALFDLTLIEALYINHIFNRTFEGSEKDMLLEKANRADRSVFKIKRQAHRLFKNEVAEAEILTILAEERVRCPLLDDSDMCRLYAFRPITCRLYGIPTSIHGAGHTCGRSGFVEGRAYPTVNLDSINRKLFNISAALLKEINSRHFKMADMLVPLSMALLTDYDEEYLGIVPKGQSNTGEDNRAKGQ